MTRIEILMIFTDKYNNDWDNHYKQDSEKDKIIRIHSFVLF